MKPVQKVNKSSYNPPPIKSEIQLTKKIQHPKLRAQIIEQKILKKQQSSSQSQSQQQSYDSQVQDFANEFYDQATEKADKSLQQKNDNQMSPQKQNNAHKLQQNKQTSKIKKVQTDHDKISSRLKQLKANYDNLDIDAILFKKKDQKKLKQIAQFLSKKHMQKRQFKKKLKKIKNSQKQRKNIQKEMKQKEQKQQHQKRLRQIRKLSSLIKQKVQKKKQQNQVNLQKVQQFYQQFHKKYKNRKIYQLMQINDKRRRNKEIQKQKQYLKQRKQYTSQIVRSEDLILFKKRQIQLLRDLQKVKSAQKTQRYQEIALKNKQLRDRIYISNQYLQIQEQEINKQKERKIPKQKLFKIKNYNSYVKENFMPTNEKDQEGQQIEPERQTQQNEQKIIQIKGKFFKQVKKIRYLKGQKIGEVICNIPIAMTQKQIKMVGNGYLQQVKLLPKKRHSTSVDLSRISQQKMKVQTARQKIEIPKISKKIGRISLPKDASRYQVQNLIKSLKAKDQLISRKQHYLKIANKDKNGSEGNPQKWQLDDTLLDNIQKKINLLGRL